VLHGVPWDQIVEAAREDPTVDLIVMATHGRSGLARVLLGSVAEQVIRHALCSVLAARAPGGVQPFRKVLCPIDFSEESRHALERAAELPGGHRPFAARVAGQPGGARGGCRSADRLRISARHVRPPGCDPVQRHDQRCTSPAGEVQVSHGSRRRYRRDVGRAAGAAARDSDHEMA